MNTINLQTNITIKEIRESEFDKAMERLNNRVFEIDPRIFGLAVKGITSYSVPEETMPVLEAMEVLKRFFSLPEMIQNEV